MKIKVRTIILIILSIALGIALWAAHAEAQSNASLWKTVPGVANQIQPYNNAQTVNIPSLGAGTFCIHAINGVLGVTAGDCGTGGLVIFKANGGGFMTSSTVDFQQGTNITITTSSAGVYTISASGGGGSGGLATSSLGNYAGGNVSFYIDSSTVSANGGLVFTSSSNVFSIGSSSPITIDPNTEKIYTPNSVDFTLSSGNNVNDHNINFKGNNILVNYTAGGNGLGIRNENNSNYGYFHNGGLMPGTELYNLPWESGWLVLGTSTTAGDCVKWLTTSTIGDAGFVCPPGGSGLTGNATATYLAVYTASGTLAGFSGLTYASATSYLTVTGGYPLLNITNTNHTQFAGSGIDLYNGVTSTAQGGYTFYSGVNDAANTQGYFALNAINASGTATGQIFQATASSSFTIYPPLNVNGTSNQLTQNSNGDLQFQSLAGGSNGESSIFTVFATTTCPEESTLTLLRQGSSGQQIAFDVANQNYVGCSLQGAVGNGGVPYIDMIEWISTSSLKFEPIRTGFWTNYNGLKEATNTIWALQLATTSVAIGNWPYSTDSSATPLFAYNDALQILGTGSNRYLISAGTATSTPVFMVNNLGAITADGPLNVYPNGAGNQFFFAQDDGAGGIQFGAYNSGFVGMKIDGNPLNLNTRAADPVNIGTNAFLSPLTLFGSLTQSSGTVSLASTTINGNATTTRLTITGLGSGGNPCLTVSATGVVATSTCSSGGGSVSTSSAITVNNFPFWTSVTGGLSGTSTLTISGTTLNSSGTITQNGIAVSTATNTTSLTSSSTFTIYIDVNRGDSYTANGSILNPYKSFSAAIAASAGIPSVAYYVTPGTYVEGAPLSFSTSTFVILGNEATLVVPSGATLNSSYDIYDLTVSGNIIENDTSTTNTHQWENSVITGNYTANGLTTFTGMTLPTRGTILTVATGTNFTAVNNYFANSFNVQGMANLDGIGIFASTTSPVVKVTSGGQLTMNGGTVFNYGGPGIDVSASGATSSPNEISNVSIVVLATSTTSTVYCGTSNCLLSDLATLSDLQGGFHAPSGTVWSTSYNENKVIFNAFSFGTSTMATGTVVISGVLNTLVTNALGLFSSTGTLVAYGGASACAAGNAVTTISAIGGTTCAAFGSSNVSTSSPNTWTALQTFTGGLTANSTTTNNSSTFLVGNTSIGTTTQSSTLYVVGTSTFNGTVVIQSNNLVDATGNKYSTSTGSASGGNGNLFATPTSSILANNLVVYQTAGSSTVKATSSIYNFATNDVAINSSTDNGLFSVVNASNAVVFKLSTTTNATSSGISLNILGNASTSVTTPISVLQILGSGHINSTGTLPVVSSCGTSPSIVGTDIVGTVTVGTVAATGCTITFKIPYEATPHCQVTSETSLASAISYSISTTAITVTDVGSLVSDLLDYDCMMGGNL